MVPGTSTVTLVLMPTCTLMWTSSRASPSKGPRARRAGLDLDVHFVQHAAPLHHQLVVRRQLRPADHHRLELRGIDVDAADDQHVVVAPRDAQDAAVRPHSQRSW